MITSHVESFTDRLEELKPLFVPHWRELALDQDTVPLEPMYEIYIAREAAGELLLVTLRERGEVIAYFIGFIAPGLHYRSCLTLTMDIFWLHPNYRAEDSLSAIEETLLARQLFDRVLLEARQRGIKRVFFGSKAHRDASSLFEQLGMIRTDVYYSRLIGEE